MDAMLDPFDKDCRGCWPLPPTEQPENIQKIECLDKE